MKKLYMIFSVTLMAFFTSLTAQTYMIDSFDSSAVKSIYDLNVEGGLSSMEVSDNHTDFVEGTGSLDVKSVIGAYHPYGSYSQLIFRTEGTDVLDWETSDSLSIWIKVRSAPTHPEYMVFRYHIADRPTPDDPVEDYIYENGTVLDAQSEWIELKVPLIEREQPGTEIPDSTGFILAPTTWGGFSYNNRILDRDKIVGYNIGMITTGWTDPENIPADSIEVTFDAFTRFGARSAPFIIFNGMAVPSQLGTPWPWGQSSIGLEEGAGATPGTNALVWTQGDQWGNGWTGIGFDVVPAQNMKGGWMADSLKIKLKAGSATGALRMQFESGEDGKVGIVFSPFADNQWHDYVLPLKDFVYQDNTDNFDTTAVTVVGLMAEASAVAGNVIYIDDWWTGSPDFDVVPPSAPDPVLASISTEHEYVNLITWAVPEPDADYDIYYSDEVISDVKASGVDWAGSVASTEPPIFLHQLVSPVSDSIVSYYYAVTATDEAGNVSEPGITNTPVTNNSKGIVTISMDAPVNFAADGDLGEWIAIAPIRIIPSEGAHIAENTTISGDNDLSVLAYLAVDMEYLYVAFDVTDDVIDTISTNSWEKDSPDLFIGLYDLRGKPHSLYKRGSEPDYHIRFNHHQLYLDTPGGHVMMTAASPSYYWGTKFPAGYILETKISWVELAALEEDNVFIPVEGYKIPIDFSINDADGSGTREGILALSLKNDDTSYQSPVWWVFTWLGELAFPSAIGENPAAVVYSYRLEQNYPNPFNPVTTIRYAIQKQDLVQLEVYNIAGQKVATLVNEPQIPGEYTVQFDAHTLSTGIYFYTLKAGNYQKVKKMILLK